MVMGKCLLNGVIVFVVGAIVGAGLTYHSVKGKMDEMMKASMPAETAVVQMPATPVTAPATSPAPADQAAAPAAMPTAAPSPAAAPAATTPDATAAATPAAPAAPATTTPA